MAQKLTLETKWRILSGKHLENIINDLDECPTIDFGMETPYIILSRVDGNSWEEQYSNFKGSVLYWDSVMQD